MSWKVKVMIKKEKKKAAVCQLYLRLWNTTLALWRHKSSVVEAYIDIYCSTLNTMQEAMMLTLGGKDYLMT